jgi:hypothetical protein
MLPRTIISTLGFALLGASSLGCAARGRATVATGVSADATYVSGVSEPTYVSGAQVIIEEPAPQRVVFREPPPLVVVEPDVYVVEDSSYAIYFVSGFYWHVGSGGRWYRSSRWDEPWVHVDLHVVPPRISHRDHHSYVHFRASASAHVYRQPRERGGNDRALRVAQPSELVMRARAERDRKARVEPRRDDRKPTPAAGPKPEKRRVEDTRPDRDDRRTAPKVDRDQERKRVEPRREVERDRVKPIPRPDVDRDRVNPRPELDRDKPHPQPDQARPDDKKKKKVIRKKVDDKRKPKEPARGRPPRDDSR